MSKKNIEAYIVITIVMISLIGLISILTITSLSRENNEPPEKGFFPNLKAFSGNTIDPYPEKAPFMYMNDSINENEFKNLLYNDDQMVKCVSDATSSYFPFQLYIYTVQSQNISYLNISIIGFGASPFGRTFDVYVWNYINNTWMNIFQYFTVDYNITAKTTLNINSPDNSSINHYLQPNGEIIILVQGPIGKGFSNSGLYVNFLHYDY